MTLYTELIALLAMLCCTGFCLAEASTTFEDLSLGGCHCKSCNCKSVIQECPTDRNLVTEHKRGLTIFHDLQLSECSCEACTCNTILDIEDCSEAAATDQIEKPEPLYKNCKELFDNGYDESGVYTVNVDSENSFEVYCDMETDGGGWTVFQRRVNGSVDFYLNWIDYQNGFGDLTGEFWLGLDKIHLLTTNNTTLRVDLEDSNENKAFAKYSTFKVGNVSSKYILIVGGYNGTAGDSLAYHNSMKFTTRDHDNDNHPNLQCAHVRRGAWWYNACCYSNLNGLYLSGQDNVQGMEWRTWKNHISIPYTEMKLK